MIKIEEKTYMEIKEFALNKRVSVQTVNDLINGTPLCVRAGNRSKKLSLNNKI